VESETTVTRHKLLHFFVGLSLYEKFWCCHNSEVYLWLSLHLDDFKSVRWILFQMRTKFYLAKFKNITSQALSYIAASHHSRLKIKLSCAEEDQDVVFFHAKQFVC
jgi:hypothetical protein